jgi:hypothetical protein
LRPCRIRPNKKLKQTPEPLSRFRRRLASSLDGTTNTDEFKYGRRTKVSILLESRPRSVDSHDSSGRLGSNLCSNWGTSPNRYPEDASEWYRTKFLGCGFPGTDEPTPYNQDRYAVPGEFLIMRPLGCEIIPDNVPANQNGSG